MSLRMSVAEARRLGLLKEGKPQAKGDQAAKASKPRKPTVRWPRAREGEFDDPIVIEFPFKPQPKQRPRTFMSEASIRAAFLRAKGNVEAFLASVRMSTKTSKKTRDFEKAIKEYAMAIMQRERRSAIEGPVCVSIVFRIPGDPEYFPVLQRDGDLDNHEKSTLDALNGVAYSDDKMIVDKHARKEYAEEGSILITVSPAT